MTENPLQPLLTELRGMTRQELENWAVESLGEKKFRGRQLFSWMYQKHARSFDEMTDLSKHLRARLPELASLSSIDPNEAFPAPDGTTKMTFELRDGAVIESVVIPAERRVTLCISSQVGCAINCQFCYTARMGLVRNLTTGEIVDQVAWARQLWEQQTGRRISNIVFMGMGEPLHNYDNVTRALKILLDDHGLNFSRRKITVSTSGLVPTIDRFATEGLGVNLAISLNATTDAVRDEVMPINKKWNIEALVASLKRYPLEPRQRFTLEYVLLRGVNDTRQDAERLAALSRSFPSKVNLIPWNPFAGARYERPERAEVERFQAWLHAQHINATIRETRGLEAMAACGQLGKPGRADAWREVVKDARRKARRQGDPESPRAVS